MLSDAVTIRMSHTPDIVVLLKKHGNILSDTHDKHTLTVTPLFHLAAFSWSVSDGSAE